MLAGQHSFTVGGRIHKVKIDKMSWGISDAWDDFPPEMITKSFRKCCITNALNGTEDEEIWEEEPDDELYNADHFEQAEIEAECFENISDESNSEDFCGF